MLARSSTFAVVAAVLLCAVTASAQGSGRVVVERFRGARGSHARSLLVHDLEGAGYEVVPDGEVDGAMRELGLHGTLEDGEYVSLAESLRAIAFVDGRVTRARRAWRLTVRVRNGADGAILGSEGWGGRTQSAIDGVGRNGASRLASYLGNAHAPTATPVAPPDGETPWYAGGGDEERASDADEEEEEVAPPSDSSTRYDSARISVSGGAVWRSMQTTADVYAIRRGDMVSADPANDLIGESRGYTSSGIGHAELGLEGELYPGAFGDQPFPYLGVLASFRHSVGLTSGGCARANQSECESVRVGTDQLDFQIGARFRYRLGAARRDVQLFGDVSYGLSTFTFDLAAMQLLDFAAIVPPMEYQWVGIGVGFDYGIVPDALFVQGRVGYRIGAGVSTPTRNVWGVDSSPGGGVNVGLELKHEANWLLEGLFVSLRFEYFAFFTTFRGQVGCATPGGCPDIGASPWTDDHLWELWPVRPGTTEVVGGVHDQVNDNYFRWGLYVGYAFR